MISSRIMGPQENQWFDEFFDATYQLTMILDARGRVAKANQAALEIINKSREEIVGLPLWGIPWPALARQSKQLLKRAVDQAIQGLFVRQELELRQRRRLARILDFSLKPIFDEGNVLRFILAEGRDITIYKLTSEALYQSEARFKSIYEKSALGILIKNIDGKLIDCNPAFQSMLGYSAEESLQSDYLAITHPLDRGISRKLFNELIAGKRNNYFIEKRYLSKDGSIVWARVTSSLVVSSDGESQFVLAMVENITTQKQFEAEMVELRQRLMHGREMERLRIAQDIHDGPLQELIGVSYQLQAFENASQVDSDQEQLHTIQDSIHQLAKSLRGLCGELRPPNLIPFGLEKTIKSHAEDIQKAHPELEVKLSLSDDGLEIPEQARIALFRIYQEAVHNIIRHAQAKTVNVRLWLNKEYAFLEIQDDGVGFELPNRWIKLARQGHLGLVGVQERAKEVGGNVEIETAPGQGTRIRTAVPLNLEVFQAPGEERIL